MKQVQVFKHSPIKASKIIGKDVVNSMREDLGDIKEVMIDPVTGRIAYAVLSFGGFLGLGEKLFAVPFTALAYDYDEGEYILDVTKERLKNAPGFDPLEWPSMAEEKWNRDMYRFYEKPPYWEV
jgi:sporulation protein YlmC with PRC-barrel domain